jgi:hypothetical protein
MLIFKVINGSSYTVTRQVGCTVERAVIQSTVVFNRLSMVMQ